MIAVRGGPARLRRDLGTLESYAALLGILIGAGIFRVTSEAWSLTGPSVILAYLLLAPAVLATSIGYAVFLSTPLGQLPGGEYTHISHTFGGYRTAFVGAWLKIISYLGALAYLANACADYIIELSSGTLRAEQHRLPLALGSLGFFYLVHVIGVRWFGRIQVTMCALLGLSLIVLIVPGVFAIRPVNYLPFFTHGLPGLASSLPPLFFAYAGFESLAQAAGEVKESTHKLPRVFLRGLVATTVVFFLMSAVAFGVLPGSRLHESHAPMAEVASVYLPFGAAWFVTLGAIMALTTSLNATMLVPSRLGIILAGDHLAPRWIGAIDSRTGTPVWGLTVTLVVASLLLLTGQIALALNIAVFALVILYFIHSLALLLLPWRNRPLFASVTAGIPLRVQRWAAVLSMATCRQDLRAIGRFTLRERIERQSLTSLELVIVWGAVGVVIYGLGRRRQMRESRKAATVPAGRSSQSAP